MITKSNQSTNKPKKRALAYSKLTLPLGPIYPGSWKKKRQSCFHSRLAHVSAPNSTNLCAGNLNLKHQCFYEQNPNKSPCVWLCPDGEPEKASLPPQSFFCIPEPPHFWTMLLCRVIFQILPFPKMLKFLHDISTAAPTQPILPTP